MSQSHKLTSLQRPELQFSRGIALLEDCEGTFLWTEAGTGGDDVHQFATAAAYHGTNGMELITRTTDTADGDLLSVKRYLGALKAGRLVARGLVGFPDVSDCQAFRVEILMTDGTDIWQAKIAFAPNTPQGGYYDSANSFTAVAGFAVGLSDGFWAQWEVVIDTMAMEYISMRWCGVEQSLAGLGLYDSGNSDSRVVSIDLEIEAAIAAPCTVYQDSIFVGEQEELP